MWCLVRHYADAVALCSVKHIVRYDYRGGMSVRWKGHISVVIGVVSGVKTFKVQSPDTPPYQNRCWISSVELPISRKHSLSAHGYEQFSEASWLCPIYCQLIIYLKSQIPDCDVCNRDYSWRASTSGQWTNITLAPISYLKGPQCVLDAWVSACAWSNWTVAGD